MLKGENSADAIMEIPYIPSVDIESRVMCVSGYSPPRLWFLDNLKAFLTAIVVVQHVIITWAGDWDYLYETIGVSASKNTVKVQQIFSDLCHTFFMTMFFTISAYFTIPTLSKARSPWRFIVGKFWRLLVPFLVWIPLNILIRVVSTWINPVDVDFGKYFTKYQGDRFSIQGILSRPESYFRGHTWFLLLLFVYTSLYVIIMNGCTWSRLHHHQTSHHDGGDEDDRKEASLGNDTRSVTSPPQEISGGRLISSLVCLMSLTTILKWICSSITDMFVFKYIGVYTVYFYIGIVMEKYNLFMRIPSTFGLLCGLTGLAWFILQRLVPWR